MMLDKKYIERDRLLKVLEERQAEKYKELGRAIYLEDIVAVGNEVGELKTVIEIIKEEIPTSDVAPVCHGHWIQHNHIVTYYECSECHYSIDEEPHYNYSDDIMMFPKYCENCGAKMDGGEVE